MANSPPDAEAIIQKAGDAGVPLMSSSSLRFAAGFLEALSDAENGPVIGADFFGPMAIGPTQPGFFWYGTPSAEMLVATLGTDIRAVHASSTSDHDLLVAKWGDGRIGTLRGNRKGNQRFGGILHREKASTFIDVYTHEKPYYASLLESILEFFRTGVTLVPVDETLAIVKLLEKANTLRRDAPQRIKMSATIAPPSQLVIHKGSKTAPP